MKKYIDNYILALLIGLDIGHKINYDDITDCPDEYRANIDRRLEKSFVGKLKYTVFKTLPDETQKKFIEKTQYTSKTSETVVDENGFDIGLSASEMNIPKLGDVLSYLQTNNNDFPITKQPNATEIFTALKQYTEALVQDNIIGNKIKYIKWKARVKKFFKTLDTEQLLENYTIDNEYIEYLPILLYGYVNKLILFHDYRVVLKDIPFCYECEDNYEPAVKDIDNTDNEDDYIDLYASINIEKLSDDLKQYTETKKEPISLKKKDTLGFSAKQWILVKEVILNYENNDIDSISFTKIMHIMKRRKRQMTNKDKLVQNNISRVNAVFKRIFGYPLFDKCSLTSKSYSINDFVRNNCGYVIEKLGLENAAI